MIVTEPRVTIREIISHVIGRLKQTPSATPRLDAEMLVGCVLGRSRTELMVHDEEIVAPEEVARIEELVDRRCEGWPVAYLTGQRGFRNFELAVGPGVLVPRPETETLVDLVTEWIRRRRWEGPPVIVDVGTGSGAIVLSLAETIADLKPVLIGSDFSLDALTFAARNRDQNPDLPVALVRGDLLSWLGCPVDVIVANLPYLRPEQVAGNWELAIEPVDALVSGSDGLDLVERLLDQATIRSRPVGLIALELDPGNIQQAAGDSPRPFYQRSFPNRTRSQRHQALSSG